MRAAVAALVLCVGCQQTAEVTVTANAVPGVQVLTVQGSVDGRSADMDATFQRDLTRFRVIVDPPQRGLLTLRVSGFDRPGGCTLARGDGQVSLDGAGRYSVTVDLRPLAMLSCPSDGGADLAVIDAADVDQATPPDLTPPGLTTGMEAQTLGGDLASSLFARPYDICFSGAYVYVSDVDGGVVQVFDATSLNTPMKLRNARPRYSLRNQNVGADAGVGPQRALAGPRGLFCASDQLLVADTANHRVLAFSFESNPSDSVLARAVIGQANFTDANVNRGNGNNPVSKGLYEPVGIFWDRRNDALPRRVYIADSQNHRVVGYVANNVNSLTGLNAIDPDLIVGQVSAMTKVPAGGAKGLNLPFSVYVEGARLAVADSGNHRVLTYAVPSDSPPPQPVATTVFGQTDFDTVTGDTGAARLRSPQVARTLLDFAAIVDSGNNRVLLFRKTFGTADPNGGSAAIALGQPDLLRGDSPQVASSRVLKQPTGVAMAQLGDNTVLLVVDQQFKRVQAFYLPK